MKKIIISLTMVLAITLIIVGLNFKPSSAVLVESAPLKEEEKQNIETHSQEESDQKAVYIRESADSSTNSDIAIINYVTTLDEEVTTLTSERKITVEDKSKLKESFITLTDFIFYGGKINGVTFNELSTSVQEKVLDVYAKIDMKIENVWPNYKEQISTTSKIIYTNTKEKAIDLKNKIQAKYKDAIGEDAYNNSKEIFEEDMNRFKENVTPTVNYIAEKSKEGYEKAKEKASAWYKNFKESSE